MKNSVGFIMLLSALAFPIGEGGSAYAQKVVHDKQKEKQWRSMETGPWDFEPFKEHKSNVKTIMPRRVAQEETQKEKIKKVEEERAKVKEMHDEEVFRAADRNVDLVYHSFKDDFTRMQKSITEGLTFCLTKSKGKMAPQVSELQRQNDMICQSIAYTHKQGIKLQTARSIHRVQKADGADCLPCGTPCRNGTAILLEASPPAPLLKRGE